MADKNIEPVNPAVTSSTDKPAEGAERKTATFKGFRKLASVRFGRKTNQCKI